MLTRGECIDALELQMHLQVAARCIARAAAVDARSQERSVTHIAAFASCEICELFLEGDCRQPFKRLFLSLGFRRVCGVGQRAA